MTPRKPAGLPYIQRNRTGRLAYVRRIAPELRPFVGNRGAIRRSLGVTSTDQSDPAVIQAWNRVHTEVEALLTQAKAQHTQQLAAIPQQIQLSPREIAGIGADPWRQLLNQLDSGRVTPEMEQMVQRIGAEAGAALVQTLMFGDISQAEETKALITEQLLGQSLSSLDIRSDPQAYEKMSQRLWGYLEDLKADVEARRDGDFGAQHLEAKAPPLPERKVSWDQVLEQYAISVGGTTEQDGIGVSKDRLTQYRLYIRDITESSGRYFPSELTIEDARRYANELQSGPLAVGTQQKRLDGLRNLFQIANQYGLIEGNPFANLRIKVPRGTEENSYRPFSRDELKSIIRLVRSMQKIDRRWVIEALLCTGARAAEVIKLRHTDLCQTEDGIWYLDFKHQPTHQFPTALKGAQAGERRTPLHPLLIERDYMDYLQRRSEGYVIGMSTDTSAWSIWFKDAVLRPLGIYERKRTGLHSIRNTSIDLWREAGLTGEVRKALVAHANTDVQDKVYGKGLQNMPDVLHKELAKVCLDWLT